MTGKPNILFLLNDHQAYYRHGWDGGAKVQRPHFDRLAAGGLSPIRRGEALLLAVLERSGPQHYRATLPDVHQQAQGHTIDHK